MKITVTADLHGYLPNIPESELLLICGDIVPLNIQTDIRASKEWLLNDFALWCAEQPIDKILFIAGNHDFVMQDTEWMQHYFTKDCVATYIEDELFEYKDLKIWGTPWCKRFGRWAFMADNEKLSEIYSQIPEDLDILMTHDAPKQNNLGLIHEDFYKGTDASNSVLSKIIDLRKPKVALCGHIHSGCKIITKIEDTWFVNCSYVNEDYEPLHEIKTLFYVNKTLI